MSQGDPPLIRCPCGVDKRVYGFDPIAPCAICGMPDSRSLPRSSSWPFDSDPTKLRPDPQLGTREGWEWCDECQAIKGPGHVGHPEGFIDWRAIETRAEYAESLLCAMAWDHSRALARVNMETCVGLLSDAECCPFCEDSRR